MAALLHRFEAGGFGMYPVLLILALVVALAAGRVWALWMAGRAADAGRLAVDDLRAAGTVEAALALISALPGATARVVDAGLRQVGRSAGHVEGAMDAAQASERARLERGLGALSLCSKIAFLAGLFGTVLGLVVPFPCCAQADAASRATMLAKGISEAMSCNAFGLLTATLAYAAHRVLAGAIASRLQHLAAEAAHFRIELLALQPFLRLGGRPAADTLRTYRGPLPIPAPITPRRGRKAALQRTAWRQSQSQS